MIDDLRAIAIFAETVRQGSFRGAAKKLNLSPSAISYNVTELEKRIGTPLLYRSTRKINLTHEGERLYKSAIEMLSSIDMGLREIARDGDVLKGKLSISITSSLITSPLNEKIATFHKLHPNIELNISYTDTHEDLIAKGIDIVFRAGEMKDSSLKGKRIGQIKRKLVCSPDYYSNQAPPNHPKDLRAWHWVKMDMMPDFRVVQKKGCGSISIPIRSAVTVNNVQAMMEFTVQGLGLSTPPDHMAQRHLSEGSLVEVLPDWPVKPIALYSIWPGNQVANANAMQLMKYITQEDNE